MTQITAHSPGGPTDYLPDPERQKKARRMLLLIFACFALPLVAATLYFKFVQSHAVNLGNTAHGELLRPAVPLEPFDAVEQQQPQWQDNTRAPTAADWSETASAFVLDDLRGRWSLVYIPDGTACGDACQHVLYNQRQSRILLNNRIDRVQRVVLRADVAQLSPPLLAEHPDLRIVDAQAGTGGAALRAQIEQAADALPAARNASYLVDPFGNVMMRVPADIDPKALLEDIKHLLKVSRIG